MAKSEKKPSKDAEQFANAIQAWYTEVLAENLRHKTEFAPLNGQHPHLYLWHNESGARVSDLMVGVLATHEPNDRLFINYLYMFMNKAYKKALESRGALQKAQQVFEETKKNPNLPKAEAE